MKRFLAFLLVALLVLMTFASCGKNEDDGDKSDQSQNNDQGKKPTDGDTQNDPKSENNSDVVSGTIPASTFGLEFELSDDGTGYTLTGIGSCTSKFIFVGSYKGLPVTAISSSAFAQNSDIEEVAISKGVTYIESSAFSDCDNLRSVMFAPDIELKRIESSTFSDCSNLTTINIPSSVKEIGYGAFQYCGFKSVSLPSNLTSIGENAFYGCYSLGTINIPQSVTQIGRDAFYGCYSLETINIPQSVTRIGSNAFLSTAYSDDSENWDDNGKALYIDGCLVQAKEDVIGEAYEVKEGTRLIAEGVFNYFYSLSDIKLPDSLENIGANAFYDTAYYQNESNWEDGALYIDNHLIKANSLSGEYTVKSGTKTIADSAFSDQDYLGEIVFPDSLTHIGYHAFYDCDNIYNISFGSSSQLKSIGDYAFSYCYDIQSIAIPASLVSIGDYAFYYCQNASSLTFAAGSQLKSIGDYAFYDCDDIESIAIPASVVSIGDYAFYDCDDIESIAIPAGVVSIGDYAFYYCQNASSLTFAAGSQLKSIGDYAFGSCYNIESVAIPASVVSIGDYAFYNCNFNTITIPSKVTYIGEYALCDSLESISVHADNTAYKSVDGNLYTKDGKTLVRYSSGKTSSEFAVPNDVTVIKKSAFGSCGNLQKLTVPQSVTSIGVMAFATCYNLSDIIVDENNTAYKSIGGNLYTKDGKTLLQYAKGKSEANVVIPNGVTDISAKAFYNCYSIQSVTIPDSVTSIGDRAFYYCGNLESVALGKGVKVIGTYAFFECNSLTSITIPNSVTSIDDYAFEGCDNLTLITIGDGVCELGQNVFYNTGYYNDSSNWVDGVLYVGNYLIKANSGELSSDYTVRAGTKLIGKYAFSWCNSLESITIPDSVTEIGDSAFCDCGNLESVALGKGVKIIGDSAFYRCSSLESITIPDSVTVIGKYAVSNCYNLESVTFSNTDGWYCASNANATSGESIDSAVLADAENASRHLRYYYSDYIWKRS